MMTTQVMSPPIQQPAAVPADRIFRLSVKQYHEMMRAGILTEDDPVELLEGWLTTKMTKNPPHRIATRRTQRTLERVLPSGWYVDAQEPITTEDSEPEPDAAVVRGVTEDYPDRHPGPRDVALVVEIADATLQQDRTLKKRLYARAGIPTYWIVNLLERHLEVYTQPAQTTADANYLQRKDYQAADSVHLIIEGAEVGPIAVKDLLP